MDEACERGGRDPATLPFSLMTPFALDRTNERYEALRRRGLAGSPDELVAGLREFESVGIERVMLQHLAHEDLDVVATIGREIAPAVVA